MPSPDSEAQSREYLILVGFTKRRLLTKAFGQVEKSWRMGLEERTAEARAGGFGGGPVTSRAQVG